ncbi:MAG: TetR/AcrR family transcriptional regulator [Lachnospiraceae bacterium]|nr:TetR/AcrR family transcriptional regulator [Lachnospiraceae bacterium]
MNPKFFDVKKEKQDAIINACLKIFAENGYKKSSTDVIVKEAGISKGLLFHYFESKKGAYQFIYDYSLKYMILELTQSVSKKERDFFEIQRTIEGVKTRVMKNYPYMQQFLDSIRFENHPDALLAIGEDKDVLRDTYNAIYRQADMTKFDDYIDVRRVIKMIGWMSEGFIKDKFREADPDLDEMNEEFSRYLLMLRDHLYKVTAQRTPMGLSASPLMSAGSGTGERADRDRRDNRTSEAVSKKEEEEEAPYVPGSLAGILLNARNISESGKKDKKTDAVNKDNVMGYMKQEKSASTLLRELNKSPEQLSFEERLAIKDTSVFGVPAPKKKPKEETAETAENAEKPADKDKAGAAAADVSDNNGKGQGTENKETEASGQSAENEPIESDVRTDRPVLKKADTADNASGSKSGGDETFLDKKTVIIKAADGSGEDDDITIAPGRDKSSGGSAEKLVTEVSGNVSEEVADFLNKVSTGTVRLQKSDSENMVDHEGIKVKKITRSDLGETDAAGDGAEKTDIADREAEGPDKDPGTADGMNVQETDYGNGAGYEGGMYEGMGYPDNGYGPGIMDPDMQEISGQYYPQNAGMGGYYQDGNGYPGQPGYDYYPQDMSYSPEDMAALAELYNNVNFDYGSDLNGNPGGYYEPQYDMNANTNEMPVNEVLAYRNAFTEQYMREQMGNDPGSDRAGSSGDQAEGTEDQSGRHKKKSFFGGLFGGKNKNDGSDNPGNEG